MITLGLNAAFHDSAAALVVDGRVVAAAEEERFTRIKHAKRPLPFTAWELPHHAVDFCLRQAGISLADVDHVAYSLDPARFAEGRVDLQPDAHGRLSLPCGPEPADPRLAAWDSPWDGLFLATVQSAPGQLVDGVPHHLGARWRGARPDGFTWHWVDHHLAHQASACLAAPRPWFDHCAVMTLDGRGERATTTYGVCDPGSYRTLGDVRMPHSLGLLYERVTRHLGFLGSSDEYKVMALAAMGRPRWADAFAERIVLREGGQYRVQDLDEADLVALAGPPRVPGSAMEDRHLDLAASVQAALERTVLALAGWLREASGQRHLAMAGGVALNCVANARLRDEGPFDAVWVQPAAGDAGTALGAALWVDARQRLGQVASMPPRGEGPVPLAPRVWQMDHVHLGPEWDDDAIEAQLRWAGLVYETMPDEAALADRAATLLADDRILGWFQGRMEWGPRALGARSILASPISPAMQQRLNDLKDREDFRPVAPAVTREAFDDWFEPVSPLGSPFMLFTHRVRPHRAERIPSACHSDGSARVQTVDAATNARYHAAIDAFGRRTGVPVVVNTSFNVRGQPVVCSPQHALEAFFTTPLDALVIGRFVLRKPGRA